MMLLAIDTSTRIVGLALYDGAEVCGEMVWMSRANHTVELAPAISQMMSQRGIAVGNLQAIAVARGPGSFTGLRIGLALAKGIALARRIPLIGVATLDILAASQAVCDLPLAAVLRAGRGRLAIGWYQVQNGAWCPTGSIEVLTAMELYERIHQPTLVSGELTQEERLLLGRKPKSIVLASPAQSLRRPSFLAELGWRRWKDGKIDDPATLAPFYLHLHETAPQG
jgi:tRNA threonylcarbamoyladenosine biosynthesis protein TsaB